LDVVASFEPFVQLQVGNLPSDADIYWATWADNEHVLVQSGNGTLILLNINTDKALWRTRSESRSDVALSPGGKYFFLVVGNRAILYETMTGKVIGEISDAQNQKFRFSPNGKRFATSNEQGIILGDTATGTLDVPFYVPGSSQKQHFFWLDDRYLFYGGDVVDTASKTVVWSYTGLSDNVKLVGGYSWGLFNRFREGLFLTPLTIPHAGMSIKNVPADKDAELVLKPGVNVTLVLEDSISKDRKEVQENITKKITANGWVISDSAPIRIVLKIEEEKADKADYTVSRGPGVLPRPIPRLSPFREEGIPIEFQPERYHLSIFQGDATIWSKTHLTSPPSRLPLDVVKDDSLQEVVDKAMEEQSYKKWLDEVLIPQTVSRPQKDKGESRVTENGIEEIRRRL